MKPTTSLRAAAFALILAVGVNACSESSTTPATASKPEITNATDNFQFQASGLQGVTSTQTYTWSNTGTRATVNHSTTTAAGSAQISIRDAAGNSVYGKSLASSLNEPTTAGTAGNWTIVVTMTSYTGTVNFRVQKL